MGLTSAQCTLNTSYMVDPNYSLLHVCIIICQSIVLSGPNVSGIECMYMIAHVEEHTCCFQVLTYYVACMQQKEHVHVRTRM